MISIKEKLTQEKDECLFRFDFTAPFDWHKTILYIGRYENDQTHAVEGGCYRQVLGDSDGYFLVEIAPHGDSAVTARIVKGKITRNRGVRVEKLVERTFGPDSTLLNFYHFASKHNYLSTLVERFYGLRVVGVVSLWECLGWSIIGQQVSVASAFATRSRLAHFTGAVVEYEGKEYAGFPMPEAVLAMTPDELRSCGFSRQKAEYLLGLASEIILSHLNEDEISQFVPDKLRRRLLEIRGIGPWSADYAGMRIHANPDACPFEDIGLRNALRNELTLPHQPTIEETEKLTSSWRPFRSYATFYIWFTLIDHS
jgi:DNA-3-methyladenine glycosylase II